MDAFAIEALHYMLKPVTNESAADLLRRLLVRTDPSPRCLVLTDRREKRRFPLEQLRYLLSADKGVELYFPGRREWFPCPFRQAAEQLEGEPDFLRVSRGCIVNLTEVLYLGRSGFHLKGGEALPVSRRERPAVQKCYNDYLFRKLLVAGMMIHYAAILNALGSSLAALALGGERYLSQIHTEAGSPAYVLFTMCPLFCHMSSSPWRPWSRHPWSLRR